MSKRRLIALVQEGLVDGWDDPRMPRLSGARRRGYPPAAIRSFWERAGVTKQNSVIEYSVLEGCVREQGRGRHDMLLAWKAVSPGTEGALR